LRGQHKKDCPQPLAERTVKESEDHLCSWRATQAVST
jgi:hypothetical protein